jgi:glycine oxidase ThiO
MSTDKINVVVVGGGVIGCCTAYFLAHAGAKVTLLERGPLCSESSSAAAGLAAVSTREGFLLPLAQESLRLLSELKTELEIDIELARRGSLTLLRTKEELDKQRTFVEKQREKGIDIQLLDPKSALEMEPRVSPGILGAVYSPIDCSLNPYATTLAFGRAARRLGANILTGVDVTSLKTEGGRVCGAVTRNGEIAGDLVVVAAGAWSPSLTQSVGLELPIEPSRGQILVTEPMAPLSRSTIKNTGHIYICPTKRGNSVIGSMTEKVGFNKQLTPEKLREYLAEAAELMPSLRDVRILRAWAGLRPLTADNLPFLGPVPGYEGLILAAGHSRLGILLSAATSKIVADFITTGTTSFPMDPFSTTRFAA